MIMRPNHNSLLFLAGFHRPPRSWLWSFKSLWAASWKLLHYSHCTGTTTSTAWLCPSKIWNYLQYFHLRCVQLRQIIAATSLLSSTLFHELLTCQPSVFTLQTSCQSVPSCPIFACVGPYHTGCRTFCFLLAAGVSQSLLQHGFHHLCFW